MALQTKTLTANGSKGHHKFTFTVTEDSINQETNKSEGTCKLVLSPIQTGWDWSSQGQNIAYNCKVNGTTVLSGYIPNYDGKSTVTIASGSWEAEHDDDGSKTINISFSVTDRDGETYTSGAASASGTMALTDIARGLVYIDNGSGLEAYACYIDNGSTWEQYIPYIDNGSKFEQYS